MPNDLALKRDAALEAGTTERSIQRWVRDGRRGKKLREFSGGRVSVAAVRRFMKQQRTGRRAGRIMLDQSAAVERATILTRRERFLIAEFIGTDGLRNLRRALFAIVLHATLFRSPAAKARLREILSWALERCGDERKALSERFKQFDKRSLASRAKGIKGSLWRARQTWRGKKVRLYRHDLEARAYRESAKRDRGERSRELSHEELVRTEKQLVVALSTE